jgi:tRNA (cytidine/uridine-2'-O-)-methyltransferase
MFEIVLYQPDIPPNTGNTMRLAANIGARLHLVKPLGFSLKDKLLRRAGLDYASLAEVVIHDDWPSCRAYFTGRRLFAVTTQGIERYDQVRYRDEDVLIFGSETRGLPAPVMAEIDPECRVRIPMRPGNRSLNLSNAVAAVSYEAWRQMEFTGSR